MTIEFYTGTPGSGKSYHALETVIDYLDRGKHVIANFTLNFTEKMIVDGYADRFMYIPDEYLMGDAGMSLLFKISYEKIDDENLVLPHRAEKVHRFFARGESECLVVIDEAGNYFPPDQTTSPLQKKWQLFFRQHRKLGFDFLLISQGNSDINKTIRKCVEYEVSHRKANRVAPFKWLPWTFFYYVRYWVVDNKRQLLGSESSVYVKRFASLYDTHALFGNFESVMDLTFNIYAQQSDFNFEFGNMLLINKDAGEVDFLEQDDFEKV